MKHLQRHVKTVLFCFIFGHHVLGYSIPMTVQKRELQETLIVAGRVEPANSQKIFPSWPVSIQKFHVKIGQKVKKGDLIAETDMGYTELEKKYLESYLSVLSASHIQNQITEKYLLADLLRTKALIARGILAETTLEKIVPVIRDAKLSTDNIAKQFDRVKEQIKEVDGRLKKANFYTTIDGTVTNMTVNPDQIKGALIAYSETLIARIDEPDHYVVVSQLFDTEAKKLKKGMPCSITINRGVPMDCKVLSVSELANQTKEGQVLFKVLFEFEKPGTMLSLDILAEVSVQIGVPRSVLSVSWNAVQQCAEGTYVNVFSENKGQEVKLVELGEATKDYVEVRSGLVEGQIVQGSLW